MLLAELAVWGLSLSNGHRLNVMSRDCAVKLSDTRWELLQALIRNCHLYFSAHAAKMKSRTINPSKRCKRAHYIENSSSLQLILHNRTIQLTASHRDVFEEGTRLITHVDMQKEVWIGSNEVWTSATSPRIGSFPGESGRISTPGQSKKECELLRDLENLPVIIWDTL